MRIRIIILTITLAWVHLLASVAFVSAQQSAVPHEIRLLVQWGEYLTDLSEAQTQVGLNHRAGSNLILYHDRTFLIPGLQMTENDKARVHYYASVSKNHISPYFTVLDDSAGPVSILPVPDSLIDVTAWCYTYMHEQVHRWQMSLGSYSENMEKEPFFGENHALLIKTMHQQLQNPKLRSAVIQLIEGLSELAEGPSGKQTKKTLAAWNYLKHSMDERSFSYFEYSIWQEGFAKYLEFKVATTSAGQTSHDVSASYLDHKEYSDFLAYYLFSESMHPRTEVHAYRIGALLAIALDAQKIPWLDHYKNHPFDVNGLFLMLQGNRLPATALQ